MFYCAMLMPVCGMGYIVEAMLSGGLGEATLLLIVSSCQRIHCCKQTRAVCNKPCPLYVRDIFETLKCINSVVCLANHLNICFER